MLNLPSGTVLFLFLRTDRTDSGSLMRNGGGFPHEEHRKPVEVCRDGWNLTS